MLLEHDQDALEFGGALGGGFRDVRGTFSGVVSKS